MRFCFPNLCLQALSELETAVLKRLNDFYFSGQHIRLLCYETSVHCNHTSGQGERDGVGEPCGHLHDLGEAHPFLSFSLSFFFLLSIFLSFFFGGVNAK
jgi:hypothetical protein